MRLSLKQMLWLWAAIMMMVGLLFGMAYQRFNGEILVEGLKKELHHLYPKSQVTIGTVSTTFLVDINLMVQSVTVEKNGKKELELKQLELKIPWWSLLLESGRVQLNVEGLTLNLPQKKNTNLPPDAEVANNQISSPVQLTLPNYVLNSSLNIRVKDLELIDPEQNERRLNLSKVIIRDYRVGEKTAFELNIPLTIKWGGVYSGEIWVFGDFLTNGDKLDINWRADSRGFKQEEWNLNDLFIEGKGNWTFVSQSLDAKVSLMQSSKKISELDIKITKENLNMEGPINQIPVETIKPLLKQFHPRKELSFYRGNELGNGHFQWNHSYTQGTHQFDLRLGFEGEFQQEKGHWNFEWMNESYETSFIAADKKLRYQGKWSPVGVSHYVHMEGREISSAYLDSLDRFLIYLYPVPEQKFEISLHDVLWKDKLYSGNIVSTKKPKENSSHFLMKLKNEKSDFDFSWMNSSEKKIVLKGNKFLIGPFGTYLHPSLSDSNAVLSGKFEAGWQKDIYQGIGTSSLIITHFSDEKSSWSKYWDFIAKNFSIAQKPDEVALQLEWKSGLMKIKKVTVSGSNLKGNLTGKLDFTGKKSELIWQDQSITPFKKTTQNFIIDEFMRSL